MIFFLKVFPKWIRYLKYKQQGFVKVLISYQMQKRNVLISKLQPVKLF